MIPKRKYTRKVKEELVDESIVPKLIPKRKYTRKVKVPPPLPPPPSSESESESDLEKLNFSVTEEISKLVVTPSANFTVLKGYIKPLLYIHYQGNHIDTLKYIKEFQEICDKYSIGSQVVIIGDPVESVGINNCFKSAEVPKVWTDRILQTDSIMHALLIKERPKINASELYNIIRKETSYEDNYILFTNV